jgi:hypothetical protein
LVFDLKEGKERETQKRMSQNTAPTGNRKQTMWGRGRWGREMSMNNTEMKGGTGAEGRG